MVNLQAQPISDFLVSMDWYNSWMLLVMFWEVWHEGVASRDNTFRRRWLMWLYSLQIQKKAGAQMKNMESGGAVAITHSQWIAGVELCHVWSRQVWDTYCSRKACREEPSVVGQVELTLCVFWSAPGSASCSNMDTSHCVLRDWEPRPLLESTHQYRHSPSRSPNTCFFWHVLSIPDRS